MVPESVFERALARFFAPIGALLVDPSVSEVMVNGHDCVFVERRGKLERVPERFESEASLMSGLRVLSQYVGRPFDPEHPILEARLPDGSRVEAVMGHLAKGGTHVAIRRFARDRLDIAQLVASGSLSEDAAEFLRDLVVRKFNILVAGGTGTGKTSLLNVLTAFVPASERVVVLEDSRELQPRGGHTVQLEARPADERGKGAVSIRGLFKATLRLRPDRIVLGEIRDGAALDLLQAMTSGHGGCLATLHASHPRDALSRLETMALMADVELPLSALRAQIASAVDVVVQLERLRNGQRVVTHVSQTEPLDMQGRYVLRDLFVRQGQLRRTGISLLDAGRFHEEHETSACFSERGSP
ncbi:MAG: ATPase, T2SS/T4P/T4SS family [Myxococcales bacterium]